MRNGSKHWVAALLLVALLQTAALGETELVGFNSTWKVWDRAEAPTAGWEKADYDDSSWKTLKAPFGIVSIKRSHFRQLDAGPDRKKKHISYYLRKSFDLAAPPADATELSLRINLGSSVGLGAYVNGSLVDLRRLPKDFMHDTLSKKFPYFTRYDLTKRGIDPKLLRSGKNVLAYTFHLSKPDLRGTWDKVDARLLAMGWKDNRFVAGPAVGGTFRDKAMITLDTYFPTTVVLRYGEVGAAKDRTLSSDKPANIHKLEITGLKPDTVYAYDVRATHPGSAETIEYKDGSFRTAPAAPREFTFGVWGDNRSNPHDWARVAGAMEADPRLEFTVGLGDFVANGDIYDEWEDEFFSPGRDFLARKPLWPVLGNHDSRAKYLMDLFPCTGWRRRIPDKQASKEWYTFTYGPARFLIIETHDYAWAERSPQGKFIRKTLSEATEPYVFVIGHAPPFASGYHGDGRRAKRIDAELVPLFEKHRISAYFSAHTHFYERSEKNGITYFVSGGAGAGIYAVKKGIHPYSKKAVQSYHYIRVKVTPQKATFEAISVTPHPKSNANRSAQIKVDGKVFDTHEIAPRK